ncbi:MAG: minor tail protein [Caudoviricetes sp.]|nr:MAG: minor tail protein [Caudoviricetes sp.]
MATDEFSWPVEIGSGGNTEFAVLSAAFGDGYAQEAEDGINSEKNTYTVAFKDQTKELVDQVEAFLRSKRGVKKFTWTPPFGTQGLWVCRTWSRTPTGHSGYSSLNATFLRRYAP